MFVLTSMQKVHFLGLHDLQVFPLILLSDKKSASSSKKLLAVNKMSIYKDIILHIVYCCTYSIETW